MNYMGMVNAVSLLPTGVLLAAFAYGAVKTFQAVVKGFTPDSAAITLIFLCIIASCVGFIWFLARYPSDDADTAKATYLLQIFPLLCLIGAGLLSQIGKKYPPTFQWIMILLIAVAMHNFSIFFTRIT
jgi:hypothetical protein